MGFAGWLGPRRCYETAWKTRNCYMKISFNCRFNVLHLNTIWCVLLLLIYWICFFVLLHPSALIQWKHIHSPWKLLLWQNIDTILISSSTCNNIQRVCNFYKKIFIAPLNWRNDEAANFGIIELLHFEQKNTFQNLNNLTTFIFI